MRKMIIGFGVVVLMALGVPASAQSTTGFKTGEQTTGLTKQCIYNALGSTYTVTVSSVTLCPLSIKVPESATRSRPDAPSTPPPTPNTLTAFKTGERVTGMTKQCFYQALGSDYVKTVGSVDLCPVSLLVKPGGT